MVAVAQSAHNLERLLFIPMTQSLILSELAYMTRKRQESVILPISASVFPAFFSIGLSTHFMFWPSFALVEFSYTLS
jgi:hypothetical protein